MNLQVFVIIHSIKSLASDAQVAEWLPKINRYEMICAYAQTELGHGSNVAGLLTEANYIRETNEFEIHSPSLESTKWWIGQLGKCANFAIVFAQLNIDGKCYGPHPFMVPIRSMVDHRPLKGITVGDIGPKLGFNAADNGFVRFDHVRIPRTYMLSRFSGVTKEGKYVTPPNPKLVYGSMLAVRVKIVSNSSRALTIAATVAVRYSAVRRQFSMSKGSKESQILDYTSQQYRILPYLAGAYAVNFTAEWMTSLYEKLHEDFKCGDFSLLASAHASSSGLKSLFTEFISRGIEECRRACGGHGYSLFSGLPNLYTSYVHMATAEGENQLITQQTVRYLIKVAERAQRGKKDLSDDDPAKYLEEYTIEKLVSDRCEVKESQDWLNPDIQLKALYHRSARWISVIAQDWMKKTAIGIPPAESWNHVLIEVQRASQAHCFTILAKNFIDKVKSTSQTHPELSKILSSLCSLFNLYVLEKDIGEITEDGYVQPIQAQYLREELKHMLQLIRKDAVALVDAFDLPNEVLTSALGRYDGEAYKTMYEWVQKEPLNQHVVNRAFEKKIMPLIKRHQSKV